MKTTVTLNSSACALCDLKEPVLLPEKLEVEFISTVYNIGNLALVITAKNGNKQKKYKANAINNFTIDISEMLTMGAVDLEISACIHGETVKSWRVPSLIIRDIEHKFALIPEIEELKATINLQANAIKELKTIIEDRGVI
jgi:hypothetical protein